MIIQIHSRSNMISIKWMMYLNDPFEDLIALTVNLNEQKLILVTICVDDCNLREFEWPKRHIEIEWSKWKIERESLIILIMLML